MQEKIVLISDDSNFFDYIIPKLALRKSDEIYRFCFDELPEKIHLLDTSLLIINSENKQEQTLELLNIIKNSATIVFSYNEDENFKIQAYKSGMFEYFTLSTSEDEIKAKLIPALKLVSSANKNNLGPGSYNPEKKIKNCYSYEVGNFGSLERRFPLFPSSDEFPGAGSYIHLATWGPKKKNNNLDKKIPPNITKKISEGISSNKMDLFRDKIMKENHKQQGIGQYATENINTIDSNTKKSISVSKNQPGFGSSFKRFYIFKNQINENNGVGTYDLKFPDNKIYQQNAAFLGIAGRTDIDDNKKKNLINPIAGPGSYRKDSYFDWNKKSYNILFN